MRVITGSSNKSSAHSLVNPNKSADKKQTNKTKKKQKKKKKTKQKKKKKKEEEKTTDTYANSVDPDETAR